MAFNPPSKRKSGFPGSGGQQNVSAAARKRAKTYDARSLAVQSADAALSATGELDVAAYVEAREFEIRALESGMQRSKEALSSRAFQKVPRSLRRRTASHNVKRVPSRLRARAKREMIEDNTPTVTARRRKPTEIMRLRLETARRLQGLNAKTKLRRAASKAKRDKGSRKLLEEAGSHAFNIAPRVPKIKKYKLSRPNPPESKFQKRQRSKTWLPTHMFHAKRAKMTTAKEPLWRFAIPLSPTEKSYRPSHRAKGARGAIAWDMSYMSTIQLEGTEGTLENVLRAVGVEGEQAWGAKGRKWRAGTRSLQAWAFEREGPKRPIAPITLIWCAKPKAEDVEMADADDVCAGQQTKQKNREKVLIRVHPSAFLQLWNDLLELSKRQNPPVMVEDLRFEIGSIDITGPGSTEALLSALQPLMADGKEPPTDSPEATWSSLLGVTNPSSLPQNALLTFSVSDPRLHFPPKTMKPPSSDMHMNNLAILLSTWPADKTKGPSALFDRSARLAAIRRLPSQKAINRRRTLAGPGQYPPPQLTDPHIPIIAFASRPRVGQSKSSNASGTWTILLPWKCVTPVWYSLMYYPLSSGGNPRFGGLKEQQQLAFEAGEPWFPGDFPGTRAGWDWNLRESEQAKQHWERRPKGRRVEFDSIDLGNGQKGELGRGWACDWEMLVVQGSSADSMQNEATHASGEEKKAAAEDSVAAVETSGANEKNLAVTTSPPLNIYHLSPDVADLTINRRSGPLSTTKEISVDKSALATVRISLYNRGTPTPRARIYRLPTTDDYLRQKWLRLASGTSSPLVTDPKQPRRGANASRVQSQKQKTKQQPRTQQETAGMPSEEARQQLAASLISPPSDATSGDEHLPLPSADDLIGFVTTGSYNLAEGKATGIGSILVHKVVETGKKVKARERKMCIVRAAGERVGRLGYWEVV